MVTPNEVASLLGSPLPNPLTEADVNRLVERINRTVTKWSDGQLEPGETGNFLSYSEARLLGAEITYGTEVAERNGFTDPMGALIGTIQSKFSQGEGGGICARVKLRLEQEAVLTRDGFRATLELGNNGDSRLENVWVEMIVRDEAGKVVGDLFGERFEGATVLSAVDGTGILAGNSTGTAKWLLIPTVDAAPTVPTRFLVGGKLSYRLDGNDVTVDMTPVPITVHPSPRLTLQYFHQRDVFSDDPFTTNQIEPTIPYSLAVMVQNRGYGDAKNFRITSAQPKIIENEKGLLIDFNIIATEVFKAGGVSNLTPSLTANFGDIEAGDSAVGRWLLTSTLQGLFIDYSATFEHVDGLGNPRLSLIDAVSIHEMSHLVQAGEIWEDGKPDFFINQIPDIGDLPDTLYQSNGSTNYVALVKEAGVAGTLSPGSLSISIQAPMPGDWAYLRIPDPGQGKYQLVQVFRSEDLVTPLNTNNFWTTDRTFHGLSRRPTREHILHLLDYNSTGNYTLVYEAGKPVVIDPIAPESSVTNNIPPASPPYFQVRWSGQDKGLLGQPLAGIAHYDIYASENNGPFVRWLEETHLVSATYPGVLGSHYAFYSVATDANGNREEPPGTPDAQTTVSVINQPPAISLPVLVSLNEGEVLDLAVEARDPDGNLSIALELGAGTPPGVVLDRANRRLSWLTSEAHGPGTNVITVIVRDNGLPSLTATGQVQVIVREVNTPPSLEPFDDKKVSEGQWLEVRAQAQDLDLPAQNLTFSLEPGAPSNASLDGTTGQFRWRPTETQGGTTNQISISVTDGIAKDTRVLTVMVRNSLPDFVFGVGTTNLFAGESNSIPLTLRSGLEITSLSVTIEVPADSLSDLELVPVATELGSSSIFLKEGGLGEIEFTSRTDDFLQGELLLGHLKFNAPAGPHSSVVPLAVSSVRASLNGGGVSGDGRGLGGRVFVIGNEPILDAGVSSNRSLYLTLYGWPERRYRVESSLALTSAPEWMLLTEIPMANSYALIENLDGTGPLQLFRATELVASLPEVTVHSDGRLVIFEWPVDCKGCVLEEAHLVASPQNPPAKRLDAAVVNGRYRVEVEPTEEMRLYRLVSP